MAKPVQPNPIGHNSNSSKRVVVKFKKEDSGDSGFFECDSDFEEREGNLSPKSLSPRSPSRRHHSNREDGSRPRTNSTAQRHIVFTDPAISSTTKKIDDVASKWFYDAGAYLAGASLCCATVAVQRTWSLWFPWRIASAVMSFFFVSLANLVGVHGSQKAAQTRLVESYSSHQNSPGVPEPVRPNQPVGIVQQVPQLCSFNVVLQILMHVTRLRNDVEGQCQAAETHLKNCGDVYQILFPAKMGNVIHRSRDLQVNLSHNQVSSLLRVLCQTSEFVAQLDPEEHHELKTLLNQFKTAIEHDQPTPDLVDGDLKKVQDIFLSPRQSDKKASNPSTFQRCVDFIRGTFRRQSAEPIDYHEKIRKLLAGYKTDFENRRKAYQALSLSIKKYSEAQGKQSSINLSGGWLGGSEIAPILYLLSQDPAEFLHQIFKMNFGFKPSAFLMDWQDIRRLAPLKDLNEIEEKEREKVKATWEGKKATPQDVSHFPQDGTQITKNPPDLLQLYPGKETDGQQIIDALLKEQQHQLDPKGLSYFLNSQNEVQCYYTQSSKSGFLKFPKCLQIKIERWHDGKKNKTVVDMPDKLFVGPHCYKKVAAIEHYGEELAQGTYVAHVIQGQDRWYTNGPHVSKDPIPDKNRTEDNYYLYVYEKILK